MCYGFPGRVISMSLAVLRALVMADITHGIWDTGHCLACQQFTRTIYGEMLRLSGFSTGTCDTGVSLTNFVSLYGNFAKRLYADILLAHLNFL